MPGFSWTIFLLLALIFAASSLIFWALVLRATTHRRWVELGDWASDRQFKVLSQPRPALPAALAPLHNLNPRVELELTNGAISLLRISTDVPAPSDLGPSSSADAQSPPRARWHLLLMNIETTWPATGMRPAQHSTSLLDHFSLSSFPTLLAPERFVIYAADSAPARMLANSGLRTLLPPDVGLLLIGNILLLDFSTRPFDTIEFGRLIALANQLVSHLPAP